LQSVFFSCSAIILQTSDMRIDVIGCRNHSFNDLHSVLMQIVEKKSIDIDRETNNFRRKDKISLRILRLLPTRISRSNSMSGSDF
jgi:hypothetical protein